MSSIAYAPDVQIQRDRAFAQARRHSKLVRMLRWAIVSAAGLGVTGLTLLSIYDPFRVLAPGVSISSASFNGTKVTMEQPKLAGFRKDGRAYSVSADSSVQDIRDPTLIELSGVAAHIAMANKSSADVRAPVGIYDTKKEQMDFSGNVQVRSDAGYTLLMRSAQMDFKGSILVTQEPVKLTMKTGTVNADSMQILNNGQQITFAGNVVTIMNPASEDSAASGIKGTSP